MRKKALKPVSFKKGRKHLPRLSAPYVPGRHSRRFWTDTEQALIRKYYPHGADAALAHLPGRTISGIQGQAHAMGIHGNRGRGGGPKKRVKLPAGIDDKIKAAWPLLKGRGAVREMAIKLGVKRTWLSGRALQLGLTVLRVKEPNWTQAEKNLMKKVPLNNPKRASTIFRQHGFKRTPTAIMVMAKRIGLSRRDKSTFSGTSAADLLGMDNKTITQWCVSGQLKATRKKTQRLPQQGGDTWSIKPTVLRQYIIDNIGQIDIRKVEKFGFVALLTKTERL